MIVPPHILKIKPKKWHANHKFKPLFCQNRWQKGRNKHLIS